MEIINGDGKGYLNPRKDLTTIEALTLMDKMITTARTPAEDEIVNGAVKKLGYIAGIQELARDNHITDTLPKGIDPNAKVTIKDFTTMLQYTMQVDSYITHDDGKGNFKTEQDGPSALDCIAADVQKEWDDNRGEVIQMRKLAGGDRQFVVNAGNGVEKFYVDENENLNAELVGKKVTFIPNNDGYVTRDDLIDLGAASQDDSPTMD